MFAYVASIAHLRALSEWALVGESRGMKEKDACCKGLRGWALAWHKYAAHGGPYPKRSRRGRKSGEPRGSQKGEAMTHTPGPWEQWKVQAYRHLGAAGDGITEVELIGLPGYLREWKPWPACISAIAQYIAYHLNFREGESRYVTVQGKETE